MVINKQTIYPSANDFISDYVTQVSNLLGDNLVGVYLFGSLTYGDFNPNSSDIDLLTLVKNPLAIKVIEKIEKLHKDLEQHHSKWKNRVESSYTPINMLGQITPPIAPRPYYGEGKMWHEADYGNEWIINLYLLKKHGITLFGTNLHQLIDNVDIVEVQKACIRDLFKEWEPKLREPDWLNNSHYQSYLILNLCRILYTVLNANPRSKKVSSQWVKKTYPQWGNLVETAENWHYGTTMTKQTEALEFLKFVIDRVKQHELYSQIS